MNHLNFWIGFFSAVAYNCVSKQLQRVVAPLPEYASDLPNKELRKHAHYVRFTIALLSSVTALLVSYSTRHVPTISVSMGFAMVISLIDAISNNWEYFSEKSKLALWTICFGSSIVSAYHLSSN